MKHRESERDRVGRRGQRKTKLNKEGVRERERDGEKQKTTVRVRERKRN